MWLSAVLIQVTLLYVTTPVIQQLFFRTASAGANGVFSVGSTISDPHAFLRHYPELMPSFPVHPQRYPPGLMMLFYSVGQFFEQIPMWRDPIAYELRLLQCTDWDLMRMNNGAMSSAVLQMALPLLGSLVVFPLYHVGRLTANRATAVWGVLVYPMVPAFALWIGVWDQFYPLITATAWLCLAAGLINGRRSLLFLGGVVLSFGTFLSFGLIGILAPLGLWAIFYLLTNGDWRTGAFWQQAMIDGALFFAGVVSLWGLYQAVYGVSFFDVWNTAMSYHFSIEYNYWKWVFYHSYDFLLFLGIPLAVLFVVAFGRGVRHVSSAREHLLPLAFGLGLLVLIFSGTSRGEVARVWLFLTPFAVLSAAFMLARLRFSAVAWVVVLLGGQLLVFDANLRMITTGMLDPVPHERVFDVPQIGQAQTADFGRELTFLGHDIEENPLGDAVELTLYWQAQDFINTPYTVFVHVIDTDGNIVAQNDSMPRNNGLPTTCWRPSEVVSDLHAFQLDSGLYQLMVGMYWFETGERVTIYDSASATPDGRVPLGEFRVE